MTFGSQSYIFLETVNKQLGNSLRCSFLILVLFHLTQGIEKQVLVKLSCCNYYAGMDHFLNILTSYI